MVRVTNGEDGDPDGDGSPTAGSGGAHTEVEVVEQVEQPAHQMHQARAVQE